VALGALAPAIDDAGDGVFGEIGRGLAELGLMLGLRGTCAS
jgi:hypothetical protein